MGLKRVVVLLCSCAISLVLSKNQPNIVLILADDLGWNDAGFHGSNQIPTPNIDALAYNGVILNRFYALPACTPSRSALLTGQYPIRTGLQGAPILSGQHHYLPHNFPTLPEKLKELGYTNYLIGKWHLGAGYKNETPIGRGFDYHFGYWNGLISYFNHYTRADIVNLDMHDRFEPMWQTQGEYATTLFTTKAEEVISKHNGSKPLFLMLSHLAAHTGDAAELEVPNVGENNKKFAYISDEKRRLYAGVLTELDKSVGAVVDALSKKGILDDTIILFLSDNGGPTIGGYDNRASNWPLRGLKLTVHEGGVRVLAVLYSSELKDKGVVNQQLFHMTDVMPTLYAAAGGHVRNLGKIDGINQWPTLISNKKSRRSELLINIDEVVNMSGFIGNDGRYKLINGSFGFKEEDGDFYGDEGRDSSNPPYDVQLVLQSNINTAFAGNITGDDILRLRKEADLGNCRNSSIEFRPCIANNFCLFDLSEDPCETNNIADRFPEIVASLERKLAFYWKQMRPQQLEDVDPKANPKYFNNTWYTWLEGDYPPSRFSPYTSQ